MDLSGRVKNKKKGRKKYRTNIETAIKTRQSAKKNVESLELKVAKLKFLQIAQRSSENCPRKQKVPLDFISRNDGHSSSLEPTLCTPLEGIRLSESDPSL